MIRRLRPLQMIATLRRAEQLAWRVLLGFARNNGLLLASAVGYNGLLSLLPGLALILLAVSHLVDEQDALRVVEEQTTLILPGSGEAIAGALAALLDDRRLATVVGTGALLLFGSLGFRVLETAMATIFSRRRRVRRPLWRSLFIPPLYLIATGIVLLALTMLSSALDLAGETGMLSELRASDWGSELGWRLVSFVCLTGLFVSVYRVMPPVRVPLRTAIVGGAVAAVLWETVRGGLVWYFDNVSFVNAIYGSLAAVIILLLSMEIGAIILLLGAQVIAELQAGDTAGGPPDRPRA